MNDIDSNVDVNAAVDVNTALDVDVESGNDSTNIILKIITFLGPIIAAIAMHFVDKRNEKKEIDKAYNKGYAAASEIYERKLRKLSEAFLSGEKSWKEEREEYEALIDLYDKIIDDLEKKTDKSDDDENGILFLMAKKKELMRIKREG